MINIYGNLFSLLKEKKPAVLATIIETKGSTPQIPGVSALFSLDGLIAGTLGGGFLEADAQKQALRAFLKKAALLTDFSLKADISEKNGAICGGHVKVLIDAIPERNKRVFQSLVDSLNKREPGVLATFLNTLSPGKVSLLRYWIAEKTKNAPPKEEHLCLFHDRIQRVLKEGKIQLLNIKEKIFPLQKRECFLFAVPIFPLPQLFIIGAGHIGQAVSRLGSYLNFEVTVMDDRPEFANRERLPDADHIIVDDIGLTLHNISISKETYIVIVTRGHSHDTEALRQCISSEAAYIGMIGSKRKVSLMRKNFLSRGWATVSQFNNVHAPIGIDIDSKTVEEIAVSIAAQLVQVRSQIQKKKGKKG